MAEYIRREDVLEILHKVRYECVYNRQNVMYDGKVDVYKALVARIKAIPAADVVERKTGKNVATEYDDCDQFVCSECGIELQDWHRVERDEDDGDVTYHEYRFRFCPNCGMKINGGDDDV